MAEKVLMMTMMAVICKLSSASLSVVRQKRRGKNVKVRPLKKHQNAIVLVLQPDVGNRVSAQPGAFIDGIV